MRIYSSVVVGLTWISLCLVAGTARAADELSVAPALRGVVNQQAVGLGRLHQNYREYNNGLAPGIGDILDREDGNITQLSYRATVSQQRILANAAVDYATGDTFYDGHLMSGAPATDTTRNNIFAMRANLGYVVWSDEKALLAPQLEFGYRFWTRHINGTGQEERYSHLLLGVGVRAYYALNQSLVLKGMAFTGTTVDPKIEGTAGLNWDPASLGTAAYRRVGIGLDYGLRDGWHVGAAIDYVTWRYKESGLFLATYDNGVPAGYYLEPESRTAQTSYLLTIGHEF